MKRHVQKAGIRNWYGSDFLDLQGEPLKVADQLLGQYGAFIVSGCQITANGGKYDIAPGLVMLTGIDPEGTAVQIVVPFAGTTIAQTLPLFLTLGCDVIEDTYNDGESKPVAYDYQAVATGVRPAGNYLEMKVTGTPRLTDAIQDALHRFITDTERTTWNAKETTEGAQTKATAALTTAKAYADTRETVIKAYADSGSATNLATAKAYVDALIQQLVNGSPAALDTLQELAAALGNDPNFATTVLNKLAAKQDKAANIQIANFNTFNPSTDPEVSKLAVGESCNFYSYNATGMPPTRTTVYGWAGTITRVYASYYRITAMSNSGTDAMPQLATRLYYGSTVYTWQMLSDDLYTSSNGYTKLPSGLMIQWGSQSSAASGVRTTSFNLSFSTTPFGVFVMPRHDAATNMQANTLRSFTASSFTTYSTVVDASIFGPSTVPYCWIAIGTWK